jgi:hypothetical protein
MLLLLFLSNNKKNNSLERAQKKLQKISDRLENNILEKPQYWEKNFQQLKTKAELISSSFPKQKIHFF